MPLKPRETDTDRFLEELAATLDLRKSIEKLGLTEEDARSIFRGLVKKKAAHRYLFEDRVSPVKTGLRGPYTINVDGASRGNPGPAGAGGVIRDSEGNVVKKLKRYLGVVTNNMAEYQALIMALEAARVLDIKEAAVLADSELMVKQLNGVYKVKSEDLRPLYEKALVLLKGFKSCKIKHVYREENKLADELANEAIDGHMR